MFEFFIALFGGSYYLGKYANEKSAHKRCDREIQGYRNRVNFMKSKVSPGMELDREIENYVKCGNNLNKIFKELEEDFLFIFGKDWKNKILLPGMPGYWDGYVKGKYNEPYWYGKHERYIYIDHAYWVKLLLLAKQGKCFGMYFVDAGYPFSKDYGEEIHRFAQRVEYHLIKNSGCDPEDVKLYYKPLADDYWGSGHLVFGACRMSSGTYKRLW